MTVLNSSTRSPLSLPTVSGPGGFFVVDVPTSGAFTLVATARLNGVSEVYGRSYDQAPTSRFLHINAITSVATRYQERHPSMHAADAEIAVKRALGVPLALDAGTFGHAHGTTRFSHTTFLRAARAYSGGEPA
ncbi:MAG: hypothetical protein EB084_24415 [Proteobacteria bacterium]|nr:hypothetical protein [Pseudomonadota bacterium]